MSRVPALFRVFLSTTLCVLTCGCPNAPKPTSAPPVQPTATPVQELPKKPSGSDPHGSPDKPTDSPPDRPHDATPDPHPGQHPGPLPTKGFRVSHKRSGGSARLQPHMHVTESESQAAATWHKSLPFGLIDHFVDGRMELTKSYPVTVTIHGENAPAAPPAKAGTVTDKLQVSPRMVVELTQPDNPDGFAIEPAETQPPRLIASDGATTWTWKVTPQHLGDLKLHIAAYVLYEDDPNNRLSYATYDSPVTVHSVTVHHESKSAWEWVQQNPGKTLEYLLPGGAGAALIGKLIDLWRKRKKKNGVGEKGDDPEGKNAE